MDRLASCYFCGDAFDASLSEYPVVPKGLQPPEDGPTVVLCGDCRRKLGAVVEEVVAATGDGSPADDATAGGLSETETTGTPATNGAEPADSSRDPLRDDGTDDEPTTEADEWESPTRDTADEAASTAPAHDDAPANSTSDGATDDDEADATDQTEPTLTKLEYNKVMRLLKNRPFPVDKAEIREVATSAYDIDPAEFDAVIEAAVSRDLIAVEDGQFVDPE
ncbi:hypothetical protein [Haloarcula sediminis]|uniref:hypothetical protein n=1 Tax=Haloarcula sediminis TaxID=3111777 RepID=UPI002D7709AD|nr:hypothetical protein [Haloarcula sp. CK38]